MPRPRLPLPLVLVHLVRRAGPALHADLHRDRREAPESRRGADLGHLRAGGLAARERDVLADPVTIAQTSEVNARLAQRIVRIGQALRCELTNVKDALVRVVDVEVQPLHGECLGDDEEEGFLPRRAQAVLDHARPVDEDLLAPNRLGFHYAIWIALAKQVGAGQARGSTDSAGDEDDLVLCAQRRQTRPAPILEVLPQQAWGLEEAALPIWEGHEVLHVLLLSHLDGCLEELCVGHGVLGPVHREFEQQCALR
mmetsp:Transcript_6559/g.16400  ORF Transcript_6559/g.16400 Transcript_6559/m.16400 type:complete len:254 (+) Transcript_6559:363-1124(+)